MSSVCPSFVVKHINDVLEELGKPGWIEPGSNLSGREAMKGREKWRWGHMPGT